MVLEATPSESEATMMDWNMKQFLNRIQYLKTENDLTAFFNQVDANRR